MAVATDIVSLADAKEILDEGSSDATRNDLIARAITGLTARLEHEIGPVVQRTVTDELQDGGRTWVRLNYRPCVSITSVVEASGTATTTLTAESHATAGGYLAESHPFHADLLSGILRRRSAFADKCFASGRRNIKVTYEAGRFANTAAVEPMYVEGLSIMLVNWFRTYQDGVQSLDEFELPASNFPTFAIPRSVRELLDAEFRPALA